MNYLKKIVKLSAFCVALSVASVATAADKAKEELRTVLHAQPSLTGLSGIWRLEVSRGTNIDKRGDESSIAKIRGYIIFTSNKVFIVNSMGAALAVAVSAIRIDDAAQSISILETSRAEVKVGDDNANASISISSVNYKVKEDGDLELRFGLQSITMSRVNSAEVETLLDR